MVCAKVQILTELHEEDSEIEIAVTDDGKLVVISVDDFELTMCRGDLLDLISALMSADAFMARLAKERVN